MGDVIARSLIGLSGWKGGDGVNVVHWVPRGTANPTVGSYDTTIVNGVAADLMDIYAGIVSKMPQGCKVQTLAEVTLLDVTTGKAVGAIAATSLPDVLVAQGGPGKTSRATQATLSLGTDTFINGRRLRGRVYVGPIGTDALNDDGTVRTDVQTAIGEGFRPLCADGLSDGQVVVFHRPTKGGSDGGASPVTSYIVRSLPGTLRSRRD